MVTFSSVWYTFLVFHHLCALGYPSTFISLNDVEIVKMTYFTPLYISIWNLMFQLLYFKVSLILNFINCLRLPKKIKKHETELRKLKGFIFLAFVFPIAIYVSSVFWTCHHLGIPLVPSLIVKLIPSWINHALHTNVSIFVVMEIILEKRFVVPTLKMALKGFSFFCASYYFVLFGVYFIFGKWLYELLDYLDWKGRIVFLALTYLVNIGLVKLGHTIISGKLDDTVPTNGKTE